ncbi:MAG: hypothetical protein QF635_03835 [Candidatus Thalassarchaeaceae archaeon]|jgi:hypothetical protein|nr:hypothetical protein [Candidatus Thalassarchaeaceae archaeon]
MSNQWKYWATFVGLFIMAAITNDADPCQPAMESIGECEYNTGLSFIMTGSCCGSLIALILALQGKGKDKAGQFVVIKQQPQQIIQIQHHSQQQPQPQRRPPPPPPAVSKKQDSTRLLKKTHLDRAQSLEMEGDLEGAITAYELAEEFREAQRVRWALGSSRKGGSNVPGNVNISIGKVGDTSVQDSVITDSDEEF